MLSASLFKVYFILSTFIALTQLISADESEPQDDSKFKYGYVISHKEGSSQAHIESRDGEMALGRYYVNHPNGSGQKVTYFADDLGFHSGVSYTNRLGTGSSKTEIAMGPKAIAALADFDAAPSGILAASTAVPLHGVKISQKLLEYEKGKSAPKSFEKLSYPTGSVKGFYLTQEPLTVTTKNSQFVSEPSEQNTNTNEKTEFTTPSAQAFFQKNFQQNDGSLVETIPSFVNQKSIEKTHFNNEESHLILEVQKHAENIIRKDLAKGFPLNFQNDNKKFSTTQKTVTTVTVQPIVITNDDINNVQNIISSTFAPDTKKTVKDFHSDSINSLKITEKSNKDQASDNSGYFKVSLSPSFVSSINASLASEPLADIKSGKRNLNNSVPCESNLCEISNNPEFLNNLASAKPKKDTNTDSDLTNARASQKNTQTFYPESQIMAEKHYITTINVQKGIPVDVRQMEDGSIRLANSFEFNKLSSHKQPFTTPTIRPILSNSIFVTPSSHSSVDNVYFTTTNEESAIVNTVTQAPPVFDIKPKHNLFVPPALNSPVVPYTHYQTIPAQNEINRNNLGQQIQHFQNASPEPQFSDATPNLFRDSEKVSAGAEELRELQKSIQELRQKILNDVDAKHEEEHKKEKFNENERRQYMENLKKVEEVKEQKPVITYNPTVEQTQISLPPQTNNVVQEQNVSPAVSEQPKFIPGFQNNAYPYIPEINHVPNIAYSNQQIQNPVIYQQPVVPYTTQNTGYQNTDLQNERKYLETSSVPNSFVPQPPLTSQNIQLSDILQAPPISSNYVTQSDVKPQYVQDINFFNGHSNTLSFNSEPQLLAQETNLQYLSGNSPLVSAVVPYDYNSYYDVAAPVSYLNNYQVQAAAESQQIAVPAVYQFPRSVLLTYPENPPITNQQYHVTVSRPDTINKLRIQPLKPSPPSENTQTQDTLPQAPPAQVQQPQVPQAQVAQVQALQAQIAQSQFTQPQIPQNLLPPSQFQQTYFFPSFPSNNRIHLRHIKKNRNFNSDQVTSQSQSSATRKAKSLSNLRIEYGFKPPLRPSVEYTEEVKPSIYGPSTRSE